MYGKTYNLHNSIALAPAEVLHVSSSPAFYRLHDYINFYTGMFLPVVIKEKVTAQ